MEEFKVISIEEIDLSPLSLRTDVSKESLKELAESLQTEGLIQPILVRLKPDGRYELVVGERRVRAAIYANIPKIPAIVRDVKDEEANRLRLIENINRMDLEIWEKADGIKAHMKEYGLTLEQMANLLHKKPDTIRSWFTLAERTSPKIKSSLEFRKLPPAYLTYLIKYNDETQERFARAIISKQLGKLQIAKLTDLFDQNPTADINELARRVKEGYAEVVELKPKEEAEKIKRRRARERKKRRELVKEEELKEHLREVKRERMEKALTMEVVSRKLDEIKIPFVVKSRIMGITEDEDWQFRLAKAIDKQRFDEWETNLFLELAKTQPIMSIEELVKTVKAKSEERKRERPLFLVFKPELYETIETFCKEKMGIKDVRIDDIREVAIKWLNEHAREVCVGEKC